MKERLEKLGHNRLMFRLHADCIRNLVKQLCCEAGVAPCLLLSYFNFASEIDKLERLEISGESARMEAKVIVDKWLSRGLAEKVLSSILAGIFNITLSEGT